MTRAARRVASTNANECARAQKLVVRFEMIHATVNA
jgi:hypothetical protein